MTTQFQKWFTLSFLHHYFSNTQVPIQLLPTQSTANVLERNNILLKQERDVISFYMATDGSTPDISQLGMLQFYILTRDPIFFNYTDLPPKQLGQQYVFKNNPDHAELNISVVPKPTNEQPAGSIGMLQLDMNYLDSDILTLTFDARKVFVKYQIMVRPDMEVVTIDIQSANNERFDGPVKERINNQPVLSFLSPHKIALQERLLEANILSLTYSDGAPEFKEFELKLPNPSPDNLQSHGDNDFVTTSILYI